MYFLEITGKYTIAYRAFFLIWYTDIKFASFSRKLTVSKNKMFRMVRDGCGCGTRIRFLKHWVQWIRQVMQLKRRLNEVQLDLVLFVARRGRKSKKSLAIREFVRAEAFFTQNYLGRPQQAHVSRASLSAVYWVTYYKITRTIKRAALHRLAQFPLPTFHAFIKRIFKTCWNHFLWLNVIFKLQ